MWLFWNFPGFQDQAEMAREALDQALTLDPEAVETRLALGYFHFYGRGDPQQALRYFTEAEALKPSDANVMNAIGLVLRGQGRWEEALAAFERARTFDPRSYNLNYTLAETSSRCGGSVRRSAIFASPPPWLRRLPPPIGSFSRCTWPSGVTRWRTGVPGEPFPHPLPQGSGVPGGRAGLLPPGLRPSSPGGGSPGHGGAQARAAGPHLPPHGPGGSPGPPRRLLAHELHGGPGRGPGQPGPVQAGVMARAHAKLGIAYALLGEDINAWMEGSSAVSLVPLSADAYEGADHMRDLAVVYTLIGELDLAVQQLEAALSVPSPLNRLDLLLDPVFDP
jgi:tetratricopeptide (TPR) repeat protein